MEAAVCRSKPINKVLTIEASGIGIAAVVASELDVPVVFAKIHEHQPDYNNYETKIESFTHKKVYNVIVSKKFLTPEDHVLIIDDFFGQRLCPDGSAGAGFGGRRYGGGHRHRH